MKEGRGGGKEREAPMHLIENSKFTHAARVTKNNSGSSQTSNRMLARMFAISITRGEKDVAEKLVGSRLPTVRHPALENAPGELVGHSYRRSKVTRLEHLFVCKRLPSLGSVVYENGSVSDSVLLADEEIF